MPRGHWARKANLVAPIRGNGSEQPILVMAHTDIVGVQRENWSVDPFAAVVGGWVRL
jgi:acetylornithine deacetylase/succinyl-diaminopimelate desuccinylase-like protein